VRKDGKEEDNYGEWKMVEEEISGVDGGMG
jgi:hypothetical protein